MTFISTTTIIIYCDIPKFSVRQKKYNYSFKYYM